MEFFLFHLLHSTPCFTVPHSPLYTVVQKKHATAYLLTTLANVNRFSIFFTVIIRNEWGSSPYIAIFTGPSRYYNFNKLN